ncbi:MAG: hypothetical protein R6V56_02695 [Lentisphaeria bacterium]
MRLEPPKTGDELLEMYYLNMRSGLLEVAAAFDRIEAAGGTHDPRLEKLRRIAKLAVDEKPNRAKRFLESLSE